MRAVLSISLPEKLARELDAFARETGRNKSDIVRESLRLYLWETRFRRLKRELRPLAKKAGLMTEEDVFERIS
ncbi:CopG family ribbon-helix-helix protein [Thermosulfurimonas sp. F29]|uniref:CopG family ribbon-helix-helix protein n=1 Tax=Thermosulfurimonas sp. F29 TaxID=2867247 RepID=UPI001C83B46A|nr:ribbon-helix-helix protein, CopG family [Thermosulfurimonas sp. F29]MBX6423902.1 ribbon-helix-helix protein, CopG family [Thermosulfurimonas sp. F29]